jgi:N-acetyl-anhydromuramyl-L-alanine amidase AmpD
MVSSPDHPDLLFVQAGGYSRGRPDGRPLWIVIHTGETRESSTSAESLARYFQDPSDGRKVSAHYSADNNSIVQCVRLGDIAWTVGNRPGNYRGINWEFAGFASQTQREWTDAYSTAMLERAMPYMRSDAERFRIPLRRCSVADLKAFRPGVTSHNDLRLAFGVTTHTDPGPNFPWSWFMESLQEDGLATADELESAVIKGMSRLMNKAAHRSDPTGRNFANWSYAVQRAADGFPTGDPDLAGTPSLEPRLAAIEAQLAEIRSILLAGGGGAGGGVAPHTLDEVGSTGGPLLDP